MSFILVGTQRTIRFTDPGDLAFLRFFPEIDLKEQALKLTTDPDHKFDLAIGLDDVESALEIARATPAPENEAKWKVVGDRALAVWRFDLAKECFEHAGDVSSLFLLHLATGDRQALAELAASAGQSSLFWEIPVGAVICIRSLCPFDARVLLPFVIMIDNVINADQDS